MMNVKNSYNILTVPRVINPQTLKVLWEDWELIKKNSTHYIVILKGSDQLFCQGLDFEWLGKHDGTTTSIDHSIKQFTHFLKDLFVSNFITIAVVKGSVVGGGLGLACACDFILGEKHSTYQLSEAVFGLIPGIIFPFLSNRINHQAIKLMYLSCKILSAGEALQLGLVDSLFDQINESEAIKSCVKQFSYCRASEIASFKEFITNYYIDSIDNKLTVGANILSSKLKTCDVRTQIEEFIQYGLLPTNEVIYNE